MILIKSMKLFLVIDDKGLGLKKVIVIWSQRKLAIRINLNMHYYKSSWRTRSAIGLHALATRRFWCRAPASPRSKTEQRDAINNSVGSCTIGSRASKS